MNFVHQLTGSFAKPAAENPTVEMVEAAYRHHGLHVRYINCEVEPADLADAVRGARAMGWTGFNCSLPHKVAVIEHLDGVGESAKIIGAVNCAVRRDGRYIGENTDGKGFVTALREHGDPKGKRVVIVGAGGAARAIGVEMALAGAADITIVNRTADRGEELAELLKSRTPADSRFVQLDPAGGDYDVPGDTDIIVNATSIGLYPDVDARVPINSDTLAAGMIVADVIPNPPHTRLIQDARSRGCTAIDGLGMLVNQGVIGIKYWTNVDVAPTVMCKRLEELFSV
jgi:shikimate dehydrogenase